MTPREKALALLRERFPKPWNLLASEPNAQRSSWYVFATTEDGQCKVSATGTTPAEAARACIAVFDAATRDEANRHYVQTITAMTGCAEDWAAHADRLAEALGDSHKLTVALFKGKPTGMAVDKMGQRIGEALAAHSARRCR